MTEYELDVELIRSRSVLDNDLKASMLENILKELKIKYSKFYVNRDNKSLRKLEKVYIEEDDTTIVFSFKCTECYYEFTLYLFKKRAEDLEKILKSYEA